jgi:hypothetical protein
MLSPRTRENQVETNRVGIHKLNSLKKIEVEKFLINTIQSVQNFEDIIDFEKLKQIVQGDGDKSDMLELQPQTSNHKETFKQNHLKYLE